MKVDLSELELTYVTNMLDQILNDLRPIRDTFDRVAGLKTKLSPAGSYAKFTPEDCVSMYQLLDKADQTSAKIQESLPAEGEEDKKEHIAKVQQVVRAVKTKLMGAVA